MHDSLWYEEEMCLRGMKGSSLDNARRENKRV